VWFIKHKERSDAAYEIEGQEREKNKPGRDF
jgi:hypothetical protein